MNVRFDPAQAGPQLLSVLHCPYCGDDLSLELRGLSPADPETLDVPEYGLLRCACHCYPIVAGIPILQQRDGVERIVSAVARGDFSGSLREALNVFRVTWARRSRLHQLTYRLACRRLVASQEDSFQAAAERIRKPKGFADYLIHRWANPSFLAAFAALAVMQSIRPKHEVPRSRERSTSPTVAPRDGPGQPGRRGRVLDLACGAGHSSFLIRLLNPHLTVVSVDHDFVSLYLAQRYFGPEGTYLCADVEVPNPFPDSYFDGLYCLDAFHYLRSKRAIVGELRRVAKPGALWLFAHLHNALQDNITPGIPLTPAKYLDLFSFLAPRVYDEMALLTEFSRTRRLDLREPTDPVSLSRAKALSLIGGGAEKWGMHEGLIEAVAARSDTLAVNPIYASIATRHGVTLHLNWPNPVLKRECETVECILPRECEISDLEMPDAVSGACLGTNPRICELISRFVLVPLPPRYCRAPVAIPWSKGGGAGSRRGPSRGAV